MGRGQQQEVRVVTFGEQLNVQRSRQVSVSGKLSQQYTAIGIGVSVGVSV